MSVDDIRLRHREIIVPDLWTVHSDLLGQCIKDVRELLAEVEWLETPMRARHKALMAAAEAVMADLLGEGNMGRLKEAIADCKRNGPK